MKDILQVIVFGGAFLVLFLPLVVSDSMFFPYITGKNFYFRILVEIIFAAWVILALLDFQYRPKWSWLLLTSGVFVAVVFLADIFGQYPLKSFWSNFERMDGWMTLVHFWLYFVVLGSVLSNREFDLFGYRTTSWRVFLVTSVVAALGVAFTAFQQLTGDLAITQGSWRITGTLGNAAYMAIYMLFNTFIALWLLVQSKTRGGQIFFGVVAMLFMFLLVQTATRGTIVGLVGGLSLGAAYIALFNPEYPTMRKVALSILVVVVLAAGSLYTFQGSALVQNNQILRQATNISLGQLELRMTIWEMAIPGIKERPILGWGQGNFNYVFNREYVPEIYYAEPWYDRAHNIVIDWLIAAGVVGLLAYVSIFGALLYYLLWRPLRGLPSNFSATERGLLFGIVVGYLLHNMVVFDNIVSYIFFAVLLALIHSREAVAIPSWEKWRLDERVVTQVVTPAIVVVAGAMIYFVNIPSMLAAQDLIDALTAPSVAVQLQEFEQAFDRDSFADQEITEQLVQEALSIFANPNVPVAEKEAAAQLVEGKLLALATQKPGDARVHQFFASFYRSIGAFDKAAEQAALARELTPRKPSIAIEQGVIAFLQSDYETMNEFFRQAYELEPANPQAQIFYAAGLLFRDGETNVREIISPAIWPAFAANNFALQAANQTNRYDLLVDIYTSRIEQDPGNAQLWASKASVLYRAGDSAAAIVTLREVAADMPEFRNLANCFIANLEAGREPETGC